MRILYVVHQFFPDYKTGTEVLTLNTAKGMLHRGHQAAIFTGFPDDDSTHAGPDRDLYTFEGLKVWRYKHRYTATEKQPNVVESEYNNRDAAGYFKEVMAIYKPDIVHVFHFQRVTVSLIQVCKTLAVPVVYSPTDFWFLCPTTQLLLSENEICPGPNHSCSNCLKHLAVLRMDGWKKGLLNSLPESLYSLPMMLTGIVSLHSSSPLSMAKALSFRGAILKKEFSAIDRILVPSRVMKKKILSFLGDFNKVVDLPFGVDLPKKIKHKESSCLRVGFIGTISDVKGPHLLTEAVVSLPGALNLEAHLFGDLDVFPAYSELIKRHAELDGRIKLRGVFPFERINEIFSELDVLVIPSVWHENTPLVAYAAQAYDCPIIASRIEGLADIICDGKNGVFYTPGSVKELADILQFYCVSRKELGLMAGQANVPYSVDDYMATLLSIYSSVLEGEVI